VWGEAVKRKSLAILVIVIAVGLLYVVFVEEPGAYCFLVRFLKDPVVANLVLGVVASLIAAVVFALTERSARKAELTELKRQFDDVNAKHEALLSKLVPAPKSPFSFLPITDEKIAGILSEQMRDLFVRHYNRVLVTFGRDRYFIRGLELFEASGIDRVAVWRLEFYVEWDWTNESGAPVYPMKNFMLVACANAEAASSWPAPSEGDRAALPQRLQDFLARRGNYVRSIIFNPANPAAPIPRELVAKVLDIDGTVRITPRDERGRELKGQGVTAGLPDLVYLAYEFPDAVKTPLADKQTWKVEYRGTMRIAAEPADGGKKHTGEISFTPSDIIAGPYTLELHFPERVDFAGRTFDLAFDSTKSGCRFLYVSTGVRPTTRDEKAGDRPPGFAPTHGKIGTVELKEPLTDLHELKLVWSASIPDHH
jgi:hypothetical protein